MDGYTFTFDSPEDFNSDFWTAGAGEPIEAASSSWSGQYLRGPGETTLEYFGMDQLDPDGGTTYYIAFDLILTGPWLGNLNLGPDLDLRSALAVVANGATLLDATFATRAEALGITVTQSYPGDSSGTFPALTGALSHQAFDPVAGGSVTVWRISGTFPRRADCEEGGICGDVLLSFSPSFGPPYDSPNFVNVFGELAGWGIDNLTVSSTPIPEPATAALVGLGLAALARSSRSLRLG